MMRIGARDWKTVLRAAFTAPHYVAAVNMFRVYRRPAELYRRYLFASGHYPTDVEVRTASGVLSLKAYSYHDVLTINEVFCRRDYPAKPDAKVIVDLGSNIGISAAYFLSRCANAYAYLFEPLPGNVERLHDNLRSFAHRYVVAEAAVGTRNGTVEFGWEETGRYGGIGQRTGKYVTVDCKDSNDVLEAILDRHGRIDILKIDVETLERQLVERITGTLAKRIRAIYAECRFESNPLRATHRYRQYGSVAQFYSRE